MSSQVKRYIGQSLEGSLCPCGVGHVDVLASWEVLPDLFRALMEIASCSHMSVSIVGCWELS